MNERVQLLLEADRRGILPPDQKAALDEAVKRGMVERPAAVAAGDTLREIPRQVGLAGRYFAEGIADVAGIATEPLRLGLQAVGIPTASTRHMVSSAADAIGLPSPQGANERVVADASRMVAGAGGMAGGANKMAGLISGPVAKTVAGVMALNPAAQVASGAAAGAAGGAVRESGGGPLEQFGASLAGGLAGAGMSALAMKAYDGISNAIRQFGRPKAGMPEINIVLNEILSQNGIDMSKVPATVRWQLAEEAKSALDTGKPLDPNVVRRIADYGVVGATPTRGTVTLDPVQITQERNLAKVGANSTDPKLGMLARLQNANNAKLIENLNTLGGGTANADPLTAGRTAMEHIRASDNIARETERGLYSRARDASGRSIDLDREGFIHDAYNRLGESNRGAFLPDNIKSLLEQIRVGKINNPDGSTRQVPFNVDVIDNLKTLLSRASRGSADGNVRAAIADVRNALENANPTAVGRPVGGNQLVERDRLAAAQSQANTSSHNAMAAFDEARSFARNRRNWQESAPGIAAALNDDVQPDRFVRDYVMGNGGKASTAHVEALVHEFHNNPSAMRAIKENVVAYLKDKALGGASDEVGSFSQSGFNRALKALGDEKLRLFFDADELAQLKALGRVASYEQVQPRGSAVNNSNTVGGAAGLLDRIANSAWIAKVPFGDAAVRTPARNWSAQISVTNALDPYGAATQNAMVRREPMVNRLLAPGLLLAAPRAEGRNDDKRR